MGMLRKARRVGAGCKWWGFPSEGPCWRPVLNARRKSLEEWRRLLSPVTAWDLQLKLWWSEISRSSIWTELCHGRNPLGALGTWQMNRKDAGKHEVAAAASGEEASPVSYFSWDQ